MNKILLVSGLMAAALSMAPMDAQGCGAALFGTGQGTRFQAYRARVPADVLIYASAELAGSSATTGSGIQDGLKKAGHRITVVSDADGLAAALQARHYDVVVASAADAELIASQLDAGGQHTGILPLIDASTDSVLAPARYPQVLRVSAGIGQFLRAINNLTAIKLR